MYVLGTLSRLRSVKHMSIKVAAYCRVSTDSTDQANSNRSISTPQISADLGSPELPKSDKP